MYSAIDYVKILQNQIIRLIPLLIEEWQHVHIKDIMREKSLTNINVYKHFLINSALHFQQLSGFNTRSQIHSIPNNS